MLGHKGVYWRLLAWGRKGGTLQDPRLDFEVDEDLRVWGIEFTMLGRGFIEVCNIYIVHDYIHITYLSGSKCSSSIGSTHIPKLRDASYGAEPFRACCRLHACEGIRQRDYDFRARPKHAERPDWEAASMEFQQVCQLRSARKTCAHGRAPSPREGVCGACRAGSEDLVRCAFGAAHEEILSFWRAGPCVALPYFGHPQLRPLPATAGRRNWAHPIWGWGNKRSGTDWERLECGVKIVGSQTWEDLLLDEISALRLAASLGSQHVAADG